MPLAFAAAFAGVLGSTIGSFLNVVAYRLPRRESLVRPGSRCPGCGTAIKAYDNLPVFGWLLLRGRCRNCKTRISPRYPIIEALTAVLAVTVVLTKQSGSEVVLGLALIAVLVPVALIDLEHRIIPNKITLPAAVVAVAIGCALDLRGVPEQQVHRLRRCLSRRMDVCNPAVCPETPGILRLRTGQDQSAWHRLWRVDGIRS